jgi:DNA repair exonuclease SbcCD ATPase subunit
VSSDSKLADELVRKNMKIKALENSNRLLKEANVDSLNKSTEAAQTRKAAADNEAAVKKENEELASQLAAVRTQLAQQTHAEPKPRRGSRANDQDELVAAREAHKIASNSNVAAQKRVKDLEAVILTLRQDLETQKQDFTNSNKKIQAELTDCIAAQKVPNADSATAGKQVNDLIAETANLRQELETQKHALAHEGSKTATAQTVARTATDQQTAAQKQIETLKAQLSDTPARVITAETALESLRNRIAFLQVQIETPQARRGCPECRIRPPRTTEMVGDSTSSQAQPSENETAGPQAHPSLPTSYPQTNESPTEATSNTTKPNNIVTSTGSIVELPSDSTATAPIRDNQQPPAPTVEDEKPETPVSLLNGQLHYERALRVATEDMTPIAVERTLDLNDEIRRYKKFEKEVHKELARANKMYDSLERAFVWAMTQLSEHEAADGAATKIADDGFVHDIDDTSKSTKELLATIYQQFTPVRTKLKKIEAPSGSKRIAKTQEAPLKIAARRNRKLRDTIREKEQEIANVRIQYGQKSAKVLDNVAQQDTEVRWLKRRLRIRESRSNSDASVGAGDIAPLSAKDEQIKALQMRAGVLRWENTDKEQKIEALSTEAKDLKALKNRDSKLRFNLEVVSREKKDIFGDVNRRTST